MIDAAAIALGMGLPASVHCFAMCGPLVTAGACRGGAVDGRSAAAYFGARLLGYATVGSILGHLGKHALCILPAGRIAAGAALVVAGFALARGVTSLRTPASERPIALGRGPRAPRTGLASALGALLPKRGAALGAATAILPCGVLVPAWALAASTASPWDGAVAMAAFASTSAMGLLLSLAGHGALSRAVARFPRRGIQALGWFVLAAWMAARPLLAATGLCH